MLHESVFTPPHFDILILVPPMVWKLIFRVCFFCFVLLLLNNNYYFYK